MQLIQMIRRSRRSPGFALAVLLLTAAVVMVNATVFSAVWAIHYKALPYERGERLVELRADLVNFGFVVGLMQPLQETLAHDSVFDGVLGYSTSVFRRGDEAGREWQVRRITPNFTDVLGVAPVLGRALADDDVRADGKVLLLAEDTWRSRFGADPAVVGRDVAFGADRYTVVGVMPAGFVFPNSQADAWMPYVASSGERANDANGNVGNFEVVARLAPEATVEQARQRLAALFEQSPSLAGLRQSAGLRADVRFWRERFAAEHWLALGLLQLASLILLAVVAASLANLVLDRMLARQRDLAICRAMGASDRDIAGSVLADLAVPALLGVALGVLLTPLGVTLLGARGLIPAQLPVAIGGDVATLVVAGTVAAIVVAIALVAAFCVRSDATLTVGMGVRQRASGLGAARASMLVAQMALATVLLGGSLLLLRSAVNLIVEPRGFDERGVLMTSVDPAGVSRGAPFDPAADGERLSAGLRSIRAEVEALPGVRHAALASMAPFGSAESVSTLRIPGVDGEQQARAQAVGPAYFATLGIRVLAGREFIDADTNDESAGGVIVDELFVQRWLGDRDPIGASVEVPTGATSYRMASIVGVVATVKHSALDEEPGLPTLYRPSAGPTPIGLLLTRVEGDPSALAETVRARVLAHFPDAVVSVNRSMAEAVAQTLVGRRAVVEAVSAFAVATLLLVVLGLYAVVSFSVRRRTAEIGVRMALGADTPRLLRLVLGQGVWLAALGTLAGLALGLPLARLIADRLFRIGAGDPATWLFAVAIVVAAALFACWWPAWRATRVPPVVALRAQ